MGENFLIVADPLFGLLISLTMFIITIRVRIGARLLGDFTTSLKRATLPRVVTQKGKAKRAKKVFPSRGEGKV